MLGEDIRECNLVFQNLKEEILEPTLVEEKNNECANEVELTMGKRKGEKQHQQTKFQNVLVRIDKFNFPIDCVTVGMEEEPQVSFMATPSTATSQAWIDVKHEEMTLLVGKEKVKFNLHQSIHLTVEERSNCRQIESSLLHFEKQALDFLQEETLKRIELNTNS